MIKTQPKPPIQRENDSRKYYAYLQSAKWQKKRDQVFQRENGICQGCREEPIENTHHTNYAHLYDEPLFELVGLCETCHRKVHFIYQSNEPIDY